MSCSLCHRSLIGCESIFHSCGRHYSHRKCFQASFAANDFLRCPVCQPTFTRQDIHPSHYPSVASSYPSTKPSAGTNFPYGWASNSNTSRTTRNSSAFRSSPTAFFSTPPSSPSDLKNDSEEDGLESSRNVQYRKSNSKTFSDKVPASASSNNSFPSQKYDSQHIPNAFPNANVHFDHNSLLEVINSLQKENQRLSELLLQVIREKEDLVSRHEEESFRMVDDFEREKEELSKAFKEPEKKSKAKKTKECKSNTPLSVRLECIKGPHAGESVEVCKTLIIGSAPSDTTKAGSNLYSLWRDNEISKNHVKLVLNKSGTKSKPLLMIKVHDLMSTHGTRVNNKLIPKGSSKQAFIKDSIQIGQSVLRITKNT